MAEWIDSKKFFLVWINILVSIVSIDIRIKLWFFIWNLSKKLTAHVFIKSTQTLWRLFASIFNNLKMFTSMWTSISVFRNNFFYLTLHKLNNKIISVCLQVLSVLMTSFSRVFQRWNWGYVIRWMVKAYFHLFLFALTQI